MNRDCLYGCRYGCLRGFTIHNQHVGRGGPGALLRCVNNGFLGKIEIGEIQEAIFEEKIFRIFFTQKKVFFLASQYKTGLYLDLLLENRI